MNRIDDGVGGKIRWPDQEVVLIELSSAHKFSLFSLCRGLEFYFDFDLETISLCQEINSKMMQGRRYKVR